MAMRALVVALFAAVRLAAAEASVDNKLDGDSSSELSKKSRFISFNNEAGEVKVELDFAVPFMKIPTGRQSNGMAITPTANVNVNSLVTVGAMMLLFLTVVPKIVQLFIPQAQATATQNLIPLMGKLDETLRAMDIPTTDCYQRSACWVASTALAKYPFAHSTSTTQWLESFIGNDAMHEAFNLGLQGGDCSAYECPLSVSAMSKMFKAGKVLSSTNKS